MDGISDEEWKPVKGYNGKYLVSNYGRVKSLKRSKEKILTAFPNNKGYYRVCLSKNGKGRHFLVSRLVADAFCENDDPHNKNTVDHIDGNHQNNRAENLRWMSQRDNYRAYEERMNHYEPTDKI